MSNFIYIKSIYFERNIEAGDMDVVVVSNHGRFRLGEKVLDSDIVNSFYDYLKERATDEIQRHLADKAQKQLVKSSKERYLEALENEKKIPEQTQSPVLSDDEETEVLP